MTDAQKEYEKEQKKKLSQLPRATHTVEKQKKQYSYHFVKKPFHLIPKDAPPVERLLKWRCREETYDDSFDSFTELLPGTTKNEPFFDRLLKVLSNKDNQIIMKKEFEMEMTQKEVLDCLKRSDHGHLVTVNDAIGNNIHSFFVRQILWVSVSLVLTVESLFRYYDNIGDPNDKNHVLSVAYKNTYSLSKSKGGRKAGFLVVVFINIAEIVMEKELSGVHIPQNTRFESWSPIKTLMVVYKCIHLLMSVILDGMEMSRSGVAKLKENILSKLNTDIRDKKVKEYILKQLDENGRRVFLTYMSKNEQTGVFGYTKDVGYTQTKKVLGNNKRKRHRQKLDSPDVIDEEGVYTLASFLARKTFREYNPNGQPTSSTVEWDTFQFSTRADGKCINEQLGGALCLLQLCIGSRSRGIILMNTFDVVDYESAVDINRSLQEQSDRNVDFALDKHFGNKYLIKTGRISKDKTDSRKIQKQILDDPEITYSQAEEKVFEDNVHRFIVKPFQFYFLDPNSYKWTGGDDGNLAVWSQPDDRDTRYVFFNLLVNVRHCIFTANVSGRIEPIAKDLIETMETKINGRVFEYNVLKLPRDMTHEIDFQTRKKVVESARTCGYDVMIPVCRKAFKLSGVRGNTPVFNTHHLRRLYVCYSYEVFAKDQMKEIGYAAKVLMHESYETSLSYTTFKINPTLGGRLTKKSLEHIQTQVDLSDILERFREHLRDEVDDALEEWNDQRAADDFVREIQGKRRKYNNVALEDVNGNFVYIQKLKPLTGRNVSSDELKQRAEAKVQELINHDIFRVSQKTLGELGINSKLQRSMYKYFNEQVKLVQSGKISESE